MKIRKFAFWVGAVLGCAVLPVLAEGEQQTGSESPPYTVVCSAEGGPCSVDKKTYIGWRTFHATCFQCHAQDAVGSTFAPNLLERLKTVDHARFLNSVRNGFQGQIGVMPAWKDDPNVAPHIEELYSYLRARSDGVLPPGKPKRLKNTAQQ